MAIASLFFLVWGGLWLPIALPLALWLQWRPFTISEPRQKLPLLLSLYGAVPLACWVVSALVVPPYNLRFDQSTIASCELGLLIGLVGLATLVGLQMQLGWLKTDRSNDTVQKGSESGPAIKTLKDIATIVLRCIAAGLLAIGIGFVEELVFRDILFFQLASTLSLNAAAALSSALFALLHLVWDWQNTKFQLLGLWVMGTVLAWAYSLDGFSLGLPWGLHAGWIFGILCIESWGSLTTTGRISAWVTGPTGQPLAGLSALVFLAGTAVVLWFTAAAVSVG